jgi:hypothetical protein
MIVGRRALLGLLGTAALALGTGPRGLGRPVSRSPREAERLRRRLAVPALAAGWNGPEGPEETCAGLRMAGASARVEPGDCWHWGSITKPATATLIARVEAGELAWDEPLAARLGPLLPRASASRWHPQWRGLTLLHLLSHRSGFARLDNDPEMDAFPPEEADPRASRLALTGLTLARPPEAAPGARFIYSNRNYIVAAAMLEAATGRPWEDLMRERLFAPLAMEGAGFGPPELFPRLLIPAKPIRANRRRFPRSSRSATPGGQASAASPIPRRAPAGQPRRGRPRRAAPRAHGRDDPLSRSPSHPRPAAAPGDMGPAAHPALRRRLRTGLGRARRWQPVARWQQQPVDRASADNRIRIARAGHQLGRPHAAGRPARNRARQLKHPPRLRLPATPCTGPRRLTQSIS